MSSLQPEGGLKEGDELIEVAAVLVVVDEILQLISMDYDVKTTDLSKTELLMVYTGKTDLEREREREKGETFNTTVHCKLCMYMCISL